MPPGMTEAFSQILIGMAPEASDWEISLPCPWEKTKPQGWEKYLTFTLARNGPPLGRPRQPRPAREDLKRRNK